MNRMHLYDIDLNLLAVLEVLLEERSVTRAATRLGRTQSAVSHALARLRGLLDDELLVRDGRRMQPTARAEVLAESLPRVLDLLRQTLAAPAPFDPAQTRRVFRLAAPDFCGAVLPPLLSAFQRVAPNARVELRRVSAGAQQDVEMGRLDGLIAPPHATREGLRSEPLGRSRWAVFGRAGHPAFGAWSEAAWARWPHLQIQTTGSSGPGPLDRAAAEAGVERHVAAVVSHFAAAPAVLAQTDLLLTVPVVALAGLLPPGSLERRPPPFPIPAMPLSLHRSAVSGQEPGVRWFLSLVHREMLALLQAVRAA